MEKGRKEGRERRRKLEERANGRCKEKGRIFLLAYFSCMLSFTSIFPKIMVYIHFSASFYQTKFDQIQSY
jgi:hypothetical protein